MDRNLESYNVFDRGPWRNRRNRLRMFYCHPELQVSHRCSWQWQGAHFAWRSFMPFKHHSSKQNGAIYNADGLLNSDFRFTLLIKFKFINLAVLLIQITLWLDFNQKNTFYFFKFNLGSVVISLLEENCKRSDLVINKTPFTKRSSKRQFNNNFNIAVLLTKMQNYGRMKKWRKVLFVGTSTVVLNINSI